MKLVPEFVPEVLLPATVLSHSQKHTSNRIKHYDVISVQTRDARGLSKRFFITFVLYVRFFFKFACEVIVLTHYHTIPHVDALMI